MAHKAAEILVAVRPKRSADLPASNFNRNRKLQECKRMQSARSVNGESDTAKSECTHACKRYVTISGNASINSVFKSYSCELQQLKHMSSQLLNLETSLSKTLKNHVRHDGDFENLHWLSNLFIAATAGWISGDKKARAPYLIHIWFWTELLYAICKWNLPLWFPRNINLCSFGLDLVVVSSKNQDLGSILPSGWVYTFSRLWLSFNRHSDHLSGVAESFLWYRRTYM